MFWFFRTYWRLLSCGEDRAAKQIQGSSMLWMVKVRQGELWLLGPALVFGSFLLVSAGSGVGEVKQ